MSNIACRAKVSAEEIKENIFEQRIPYCQTCSKDYKPPDGADDLLLNKANDLGSSNGSLLNSTNDAPQTQS
jgi:hypothetical protein